MITSKNSFEVRKVHASHLCHSVNKARNKQSITTWVGHQIKDIIKKIQLLVISTLTIIYKPHMGHDCLT